MPNHDVLVTPNDRGGFSIVIDGIDVSYFTHEFSVNVQATKTPIVTLHVRADRIRMGLPQALVEALPDGVVQKEC